MSDTASALRAVSDALLRDLERIEALEREKRQLPPDHPRVIELAAAVEEVAQRLYQASAYQRELSDAALRLIEQGAPEAPEASIAATPRAIQEILADWREAERRLVAAEPGSGQSAAAAREVERLRNEYRAAHEAARRRS